MHRLKDARKKVIGFKQSLKMIERGQAVCCLSSQRR